jgi:hypothetical protein
MLRHLAINVAATFAELDSSLIAAPRRIWSGRGCARLASSGWAVVLAKALDNFISKKMRERSLSLVDDRVSELAFGQNGSVLAQQK